MTRTEHDPICHMDIAPDSAAGTSEHLGHTYYFCSRGCKLDFDEDPAAAMKAEAAWDHSQSVMHMGAAPAKKPFWKFW